MMVHTISYITACARAHLARLERKAGLDNVYYMDTDSLVMNYQGY